MFDSSGYIWTLPVCSWTLLVQVHRSFTENETDGAVYAGMMCKLTQGKEINGTLQPHHPVLPSVELPERLWRNHRTPALLLDPDMVAVMKKKNSLRQAANRMTTSSSASKNTPSLFCQSRRLTPCTSCTLCVLTPF